ncbi:MAG: short-chain dehydrogenase [Alcaligenaceae bacterium]|nr:MAG: short-chain dehydrogenase [Alcaligenaceae bacterium]
MTPEPIFKNTVTLITGASRGIGLACARRIALRGGHVVGLARTPFEGEFPGDFYTADLADEQSTAQALSAITQKFSVDHLVNNAGKSTTSLLEETSSSEFNEIIQINMRAPLQCLQACVVSMTQKGYGRVVNLSSRASLGMLRRSAYAGAKSGVIGMTKTWALELGCRGITVNAVAPGPIQTEMYKKNNPLTPQQMADFLARIPVRRLGTPEDVANAVTFLLSPDSGFMTGQVLYTCGGLTVGAAAG